jgi:hypothetical protein
MRAPSHAIDHQRSKLGPILFRATQRRCFCDMLPPVAAACHSVATYPRRAALVRVPSLANSYCQGQKCPAHLKRGGRYQVKPSPSQPREFRNQRRRVPEGWEVTGVDDSGPVHRVCRFRSKPIHLCSAYVHGRAPACRAGSRGAANCGSWSMLVSSSFAHRH